jgi:hypothetical protein
MSFTNQETMDCPICLDAIGETNNIITECGHKFHASCIMINVAANGFNCPCCRFIMAKNTKQENDDETDYDDDDDDDDESYVSSDWEEEEPFSEDSLRGLRLLTNLLEGNENDQLDVVAEYQYTEQISREEEDENIGPIVAPTLIQMCAIFRDRQITYEQLVAWAMLDHDEYEDNQEELEEFSGDIWGQVRTIVSNYTPEPERNSDHVEENTALVDDIAITETENEEPNTTILNTPILCETEVNESYDYLYDDETDEEFIEMLDWIQESPEFSDVSLEDLEKIEQPEWQNNNISFNLSIEEICV